MKNILIKKGRKTIGFIGQNVYGYFYAFGSPNQLGGYIAFSCKTIEEGKEKINEHN